jgi:hypothetical protein|nr:MAG TPA: hypothetical protein [Caudoviricetes sp.]
MAIDIKKAIDIKNGTGREVRMQINEVLNNLNNTKLNIDAIAANSLKLEGLSASSFVKKQEITNPNLLMNGNFCSFERHNSEFFHLTNKNNREYLTDRWQVFSSNDDLRWEGGVYDSKAVRPAGIKKTAGSKNIQLIQFIENITNFNPLEYVTISFWARAEKNKRITVQIQPTKGRFESVMLPVTKELNITNQTEFYSITLQVPDFWEFIKDDTNFDRTKYALAVKIDFGTEINEVVFIQNIKLEKGSIPTPFLNYSGSEEADKQACLRYFERIRKRLHFSSFIKTDNPEYLLDVLYKVQKRIDSPTINFDVDTGQGLQKGDVANGIYIKNDILINFNKDGVLFRTKIKNAPAFVDNITIDADF